MTLEEKVGKDLVAAMKTRDAGALRALRAIKAEILLFQTSGTRDALDEKQETRILQKMVKQRQESLSIYEEQGREDLAAKEREEIEVLKRYLPEQMQEADLRRFLSELIAELGATGMQDMGRVMGAANQHLAGRADGKTIAAIVREKLTS